MSTKLTRSRGKFSTLVDEAAWHVTMEGCDAEAGSVQENGRWYGAVKGPIRTALPFADITPELLSAMSKADRDYLEKHQGGFISSEDEQGFWNVVFYTDREALEAGWRDVQAEVDAWEGSAS